MEINELLSANTAARNNDIGSTYTEVYSLKILTHIFEDISKNSNPGMFTEDSMVPSSAHQSLLIRCLEGTKGSRSNYRIRWCDHRSERLRAKTHGQFMRRPLYNGSKCVVTVYTTELEREGVRLLRKIILSYGGSPSSTGTATICKSGGREESSIHDPLPILGRRFTSPNFASMETSRRKRRRPGGGLIHREEVLSICSRFSRAPTQFRCRCGQFNPRLLLPFRLLAGTPVLHSGIPIATDSLTPLPSNTFTVPRAPWTEYVCHFSCFILLRNDRRLLENLLCIYDCSHVGWSIVQQPPRLFYCPGENGVFAKIHCELTRR